MVTHTKRAKPARTNAEQEASSQNRQATTAAAAPPVTGFAVRNLSVLMHANGFTLWHYKGVSIPLATILAPRFFQDADYMLAIGDMVMISAHDGMSIKGVSFGPGGTIAMSAILT